MKKRVVVFISGSGSNMESLIKACQPPLHPAEVIAVICDKANAGGIQKAENHGVPVHIIERKDYNSKDQHEDAILRVLNTYSPDLICLAGFMRLITGKIITPYKGRILNIHPALLPLFKGLHTHERALEAGMKIAGCTVHLVTEGMDEGPILAQAAVPVLHDDTTESLASRVLKAEHKLYPEALKAFILKGSVSTNQNQELLVFS